MKLIPLNCRQCGAPLSVPEDIKHVTCGHCSTQLAVVHEGGAVFTEKIAQLDQRTSAVEQRVDDLYRHQRLTALDQAWAKEQEKFQIRNKYGQVQMPSSDGALFAGVTGVVAPILFVLFPLFGSAPAEMVVVAILVGSLFGVVLIGASMQMYRKAMAYKTALRRYQRRRREILKTTSLEQELEWLQVR